MQAVHDVEIPIHALVDEVEPRDPGGDGKGEVPFYRREVEQFLAAVRTKNRGLVRSSYADGARSLATVISANNSMLSGEPVKIPAL